MELRPGTVIDRYEILQPLSEGGSGRVYVARHRELESRHALKLIPVRDDAHAARLVDEGRIQARIRHPNVVGVTDVVRLPGAVGLVMEFVEGVALDRVIGEGYAVAPGDLAPLFRQLVAGVTAVHQAGFLHRDLKPANVLLGTAGGVVTVRLADFGIARATGGGGGPVDDEAIVGTPGYMAPEQITDTEAVDVRADVFALGCILYEMACGWSPYLRAERRDTVRSTLSGQHIPLEERERRLPASLCAAVERALRVDPKERWGSVHQLELAAEPGFAQIVERPSPGTVAAIPKSRRARVAERPMAAPVPRAAQRLVPTTSPVTLPTVPVRRPGGRAWVAVVAVSLGLVGVGSVAARAQAQALGDVARVRVTGLDATWVDPAGPVAVLAAHASNRAGLAEAVTRLQGSDTFAARFAADAALVDLLRLEAGRQALAHAPADQERGHAAIRALDLHEARAAEAAAAWTEARAAADGAYGLAAVPASWVLGAVALPEPLAPPDLGALAAAAGPFASTTSAAQASKRQ